MKAIIKTKTIETYDALIVDEPMILTDTPLVKQEIVNDNGQLVLREVSIDTNDKYKSEVKIDVYLTKGDLLIKTPQGYMKPTIEFIPLTKELDKAIKILNK